LLCFGRAPCALCLAPSIRQSGRTAGGESSPFPVCDPERDTVSPVTGHRTIDVLQDKIDDLVKSPTPSLRGATRRGNPTCNASRPEAAVGGSKDLPVSRKRSIVTLGTVLRTGLPRFARNDISAFFGLFTNVSRLVPPTRSFKADIRRSPSASAFLGKSIYFKIMLGSRRVNCNTRPMPNRDFQGFPKLV
jgi:hypothetical protein